MEISRSFDQANDDESYSSNEQSIVSFQATLPLDLQLSMKKFIENYPNWDQYRLIHAALAGFLVQNGVQDRSITRLYIGNMFSNKSFANKN